jgi:dUTP pyrophosphatase
MSPPIVKVRRLPHADDLPLPTYASAGAAGADLCAAISDSIVLEPGKRTSVPTGLVLELPPGHEGQVRPRSGLASKHGVTVLNTPGTIDSDYRGEVVVVLVNHGDMAIMIRRGDRIAQLIIAPVVQARFAEADELGATERAGGGFGSTGR